jgi:hypothetical protein
MKNNIYIVFSILIIFIGLFIYFIRMYNLENYTNFSTNIDISGDLIKSYPDIYLTACDNECSKTKNPKCTYFTSTAPTNNSRPGECKLYSSNRNNAPKYLNGQKLYYMP